MSLTLLLDLDDTLLQTHLEQFIPAYFAALSRYLAAQVDPQTMLAALAAGTRKMLSNQDPALTLRQVFDAEFFGSLEADRAVLDPLIDRFYDEIFPTLAPLTARRPEAVALVDWAFAQGYRVAIATDPLFPLKANLHRLRFAGLAPERYTFALVSAYETFHFTKSHAAYFSEFVGRLGWPEGPVVMVGNDAERDLAPARALGLPTFWINGDKAAGSDDEAGPRGSLSDVRAWIESADLKSLNPRFEAQASILALLLGAPAAIAALADEIPAACWTWRPAPGEWALTEVLGHLRDTELEINQPRLQRLLREEEPFISARDSNAWAAERQYLAQDGAGALQEFLSARKALLADLNGLTDADWSLKARHSIFGPTTLGEMVGFMAQHDRLHIQQIWKILHPVK
ncbi:MAG TPA: DinB family protein [Anaerolineales bacterium]|jgi:FMN phosphatase YigB (HAD superfamily)